MDQSEKFEEQTTKKSSAAVTTLSTTIWNTTNKELCDVILVGKDQVKVPANKCILAAASNFFKSMFFGGNFLESQSTTSNNKEVQIQQFDGHILQNVVEFIHTGKAQILNDKIYNSFLDYLPSIIMHTGKAQILNDKIYNSFLDYLPSIIMLHEAGRYFDLERLREKVADATSMALNQHPSISFSVLQESRQSSQDELADLALSNIRNTENIFLPHITSSNVAVLSPSVLEEILQDDNLDMRELDVFNLLHLWATAEVEADSTTAATTTTESVDRISIAKEFVAKHITLEKISTKELSTTVESSGLATDKQLAEAYKAQALLMYENWDYDCVRNGLLLHNFDDSRCELSNRSTTATTGDNTLSGRGSFDKFLCALSDSNNNINNSESGQPDGEKKVPQSSIICSGSLISSTIANSEVAADQAVLASASEVFRKMLCENSNESQSTTTTCAEILKIMLEYIRTRTYPKILRRSKTETFLCRLPSLVMLEKAARYFHLLELHNNVVRMVVSKIRSKKFQERHIKSSNVACLSQYFLEEILKNDDLTSEMTELNAFNLLNVWATGEAKADPTASATATAMTSDRISIAKELVGKHIILEKIHPSELRTTVRSSGLVTDEQLAKVFEEQAELLAEEGGYSKTLREAFHQFRSAAGQSD